MEKRTIGPVTTAATVGGGVGVILVWMLTANGIEVPEPVQLAIITIITALGGWIIKPRTTRERKH